MPPSVNCDATVPCSDRTLVAGPGAPCALQTLQAELSVGGSRVGMRPAAAAPEQFDPTSSCPPSLSPAIARRIKNCFRSLQVRLSLDSDEIGALA
jgi:hypothetical protein